MNRRDGAVRQARWLGWLRPLADAIVPITMLRGEARGAGGTATMLVAGSPRRVQWLVDRFFATPPERESLGHVPAWRLARTLRHHAPSVDVAIARVARVSARALGFQDDWLPVPDWIGMRLVAPFDLDAIADRSHSAAQDVRRTRAARYDVEISRRAEDLVAFHRDVYVPFARIRHGDEAVVRNLRFMRRRFRRGGILWVSRRGERIAGLLFERRHDVMDAVALGVMGGDLAHLREGAIAALYVHAIDHARQSGCDAIDLRGSRPSPLDGLTRYKRKWGAMAYDRPDVLSTTFVRWRRLSPAVASLLARVPLIFRDGSGLSVLGLAPDGADVDEVIAALDVSGLSLRIVVRCGSRATGAATPASNAVVVSPPTENAGPRTLVAAARAAGAGG